MLATCRARGDTRREILDIDGCRLGIARRAWEFGPAFSGPVGVVREDHISVVADATLYFRDDLLRKLGPEKPRGGTPSHLIAAAYRRWGSNLAAHLEGDFTFVVFDDRERRVVAARDFAGARPLFFAHGDEWLALSSDLRALRALPGVRGEYNLVVLAGAASALLSGAGPGTCYRDIEGLPAGHTLVWQSRGPGQRADGPRLEAHWTPPRWTKTGQSFEDATAELRELLIAATRERLSPHGVTGVSLSGGWDSPAVFGAAREHLRRTGAPGRVVPVSISYPEGDPGREDEIIEQILKFWDSDCVWLDAFDMQLVQTATDDAEARPQPWAHIYEHWNRGLATAVAEADSRVLLSGYGGDQLFQASDVYLSDLTWSLRLPTAYKEWRAKGGQGFKSFFRWGIQPGMGPGLLELARRVRRGAPLADYMQRATPGWIRPELVDEIGLKDEERKHLPTRSIRSRVEAESHWYLTEPMFPRVNAEVARFALESDVELRSPLYDQRIVAFAATRPWRRPHAGQGDEAVAACRFARARARSGAVAPNVADGHTGGIPPARPRTGAPRRARFAVQTATGVGRNGHRGPSGFSEEL